ncbi:MAG: copper resistance protein CopD [Bacteroidota bacterium]
MRELYFASVFLHILAAAVWVGGMIFLVLVLIPAIRKNPEKALLLHTIGLKFRTVGWVILSILLVTGLYNMHFRQVAFTWQGLTESYAGRMAGYKLLIFTVTVLISAIHDFYIGTTATRLWMDKADIQKTNRFRFWARWAGRINVLLALMAVGIGVALVRGF